MKQTYEISLPKDNKSLPCCLIIAISKKDDIISRLEMS